MSCSILFVDDEESILKSIQRQLMAEPYEVHTATSGADGLAQLKELDAALIVSDMRMPEMDGVTFLKQAAELRPHSVRMVLSGYAEVSSILEAVNQGHVWRYITKPWKPDELNLALRNGVDFWSSEAERRRLVDELKTKNDQLANINAVLDEKVRARTWELNERSEILHMILEDAALEHVMDRALAAVGKAAKTAKISVSLAFDSRVFGAEASGLSPISSLLAKECLSQGKPAIKNGYIAFPLGKGSTQLGALILDGSACVEREVAASVESLASLVAIALSQHKLIVDAPRLMGDIDKLLKDLQ